MFSKHSGKITEMFLALEKLELQEKGYNSVFSYNVSQHQLYFFKCMLRAQKSSDFKNSFEPN